MVRITIDKATQAKLFPAADVIELVDESGKLLGRILPEVDDFPDGWVPMTPEISDEELRRRMESDEPGITTEELIARLKAKR